MNNKVDRQFADLEYLNTLNTQSQKYFPISLYEFVQNYILLKWWT